MTSEITQNLYCPHWQDFFHIIPNFESIQELYFGLLSPFTAILFSDIYDALLGNENIQTFLLIVTYTSCEYTYGIFYLRQDTLFINSLMLKG